jgi:hypothetical protein
MTSTTIVYSGKGSATVTVPAFNAAYFRALFQSKSAAVLMPLFNLSNDAAKEWTESFAAWHKLRSYLRPATLALHIGDGASSRTGALWAFHTGHQNISIDPQASQGNLSRWQLEIDLKVRRLRCIKARAEDILVGLVVDWIAADNPPVLLTFVHAHVDVQRLLAMLPPGSWRAAYTCACCEKNRQLLPNDSKVARIVKEGDDWSILSPERQYQVLIPR